MDDLFHTVRLHLSAYNPIFMLRTDLIEILYISE